jgi:hypothetical protein
MTAWNTLFHQSTASQLFSMTIPRPLGLGGLRATETLKKITFRIREMSATRIDVATPNRHPGKDFEK